MTREAAYLGVELKGLDVMLDLLQGRFDILL